MEREVIYMELKYFEEIKDDVISMIKSTMSYDETFKVGVARVIYENDYYMSDERTIEKDCHYIAIGAYAVESNNIDELECDVLDEIKRSVNTIESGKYNESFTNEDKTYIYDDIDKIKSMILMWLDYKE